MVRGSSAIWTCASLDDVTILRRRHRFPSPNVRISHFARFGASAGLSGSVLRLTLDLMTSQTALSAYDALLAHTRQTMALEQAAGLLSWDQETMMPPDGTAQRAEQAAAMQAAVHARRTDPRIGEWLATAEGRDDPVAARNIVLIRRDFDRHVKVPEDLAIAVARLSTTAREVWTRARAENDYALFAPVLKEMIGLKRQEAQARATDGQPLYDVLLDDFEPGMPADRLSEMLESLRAPLTDLRAGIAESGVAPPHLAGRFEHARQLTLSARLAEVMGYRTSAGRIDLAVHPFCLGTGDDVRITTRINEEDPLGCLYSTIHETGHAVYEQNMPPGAQLTPVAAEASMGVHESQSRMLENQIGRSRAFAEWLYPAMHDTFGGFGLTGPDELYAAVNRVETGFIRTEADEVHYNLHVILRFRLERALVEGDLDVTDLEAAWNADFKRDFGLPVPDPARGVLQDIHWSQGLFGYFPTYTLGNIYAAELFAAMRGAIPDLDAHVARGDIRPLIAWLNTHVHHRGNLRDPADLIADAAGHPPGSGPLIAYLTEKYSALYRL